MVVAALVVAIVSAAICAASVLYARRSAVAANTSAGSAAITARLDTDRRHAELTPRFRITCGPENPGVDTTFMSIYLAGPPELERLDKLTVVIRADPATGLFGADRTGRTCPAGEMFVGERLLFQLDPTWPPSWSQWSLESWQEKVGPLLRLRLECHREGQAPWILPCEVLVQDGVGSTEVPEQSSP